MENRKPHAWLHVRHLDMFWPREIRPSCHFFSSASPITVLSRNWWTPRTSGSDAKQSQRPWGHMNDESYMSQMGISAPNDGRLMANLKEAAKKTTIWFRVSVNWVCNFWRHWWYSKRNPCCACLNNTRGSILNEQQHHGPCGSQGQASVWQWRCSPKISGRWAQRSWLTRNQIDCCFKPKSSLQYQKRVRI